MEKPLTFEEFQGVTGVSRETAARLGIYEAELVKWNAKINLVSPKSLEDRWRRHFWDSAQLLPHLPPPPPHRPLRILDLGSGAGFPGLVLAILGAGKLTLVDSDQRKTLFLQQVALKTATEVTVLCRRIEAGDPVPADVVTARALAPLPRLLELAVPHLRAGAANPEGALCPPRALFLKGRGADQELTDSAGTWQFSAQSHPSATDPSGRILQIELE